MKNLKIALFSFLIVALATAGSAFTGHKTFDGNLNYTFTGSNFSIGTDDSSPIVSTGNWTLTSTIMNPPACEGTENLCRFTATWTGTGSPHEPTLQEILDAIQANYEVSNRNSFPVNPFTTTINGVTVTITITFKN